MKKKYFIGLMVIIMCFVLTGCGKKITLNDIVKKFNDSETVKQYKEYGFEMNASAEKDKLLIKTKIGENETTTTYNLSGNILSNDNLTDEDSMTLVLLIDTIGELQGYKAGELIENLTAFTDEISNYTIEKEGFELKGNDDINSIKIDLSKKIPLIDLSNLFLKPAEFDMIAEFVEDKTTGNQTGKLSKLAYNVELGDKKSYIYIGEKDKLTESAYKSILSALEVMYGTEVANNFKSIYPDFKDEKITVDRFTIDTNYEMDDQEESMFKGMKIVLVTINNKTSK